MSLARRKHRPTFKAIVELKALTGQEALARLAARCEIRAGPI